jgi:hypothetical protein
LTRFREFRELSRFERGHHRYPDENQVNRQSSRVSRKARSLPASRFMARIRSAHHRDVLRVKVSGRLSIADMGRLEHACAPALTSHAANLELDLRRVTNIDATATAVLERIFQRGARVARPLYMENESEPMSQRGDSRGTNTKKT